MHLPCWHKWGKYSDPVNGIASSLTASHGYFKVLQMRNRADQATRKHAQH